MFKQALGFLLNHWPAIYYGYFVGIQQYNRPGWRRFRGGKTIRNLNTKGESHGIYSF